MTIQFETFTIHIVNKERDFIMTTEHTLSDIEEQLHIIEHELNTSLYYEDELDVSVLLVKRDELLKDLSMVAEHVLL